MPPRNSEAPPGCLGLENAYHVSLPLRVGRGDRTVHTITHPYLWYYYLDNYVPVHSCTY